MAALATVLIVIATGAVGFVLGYALAEATPPTPGVALATDPLATEVPGSTGPSGTVPGVAGTFEVRADGDDGAAGDASAPWRTLGRALASVPPGSTIRLGEGTFDAATVGTPLLRIVGVGEASVITGGLVVRADGVEISGVTITGQATPYGGGIAVEDARDVVIRDSVIRGNPFGIYLIDAPGASVTGNRITDNGYGLEVHGASAGTVVRGNEIVDNDRAIEVYAASDILVSGNRLSGSNDMIETGTEDGVPCRNLVVTGNTMFSRDITDSNEERGIYLRCATAARIEWNTFVGLDRFAVGLYDGTGGFNGPLEDVTIAHNIIAGGRAFSIDSPLDPSVTMDDDIVMPCRSGTCPVLGREVAFVASAGTGTMVWTEFQAWTGQEAGGLFAAPRFRDPAANDYRLLPDSPAIGRAGATERPPAELPSASPPPSATPAP